MMPGQRLPDRLVAAARRFVLVPPEGIEPTRTTLVTDLQSVSPP